MSIQEASLQQTEYKQLKIVLNYYY